MTLLNFTITPSGLEDQLLVATVEAERPDLAERKNELVLQNAENRRKLQELQEEILYMLSHSEGNILDDTKLIDTLAVSKETTEGIMEARALGVAVALCAAVLPHLVLPPPPSPNTAPSAYGRR